MPPLKCTSEQLEQLYLITRYYRRVGLSAEDLSVVLVIFFHQWEHPGEPLYVTSIALRLKRSRRFAQKHLADLQYKRVLSVSEQVLENGSLDAHSYDLSPLMQAISKVAVEAVIGGDRDGC
jgi:hypothetical protein